MVFSEFIFSLLSCFFLYVVPPLNLAEFDCLGVSNSFRCLQDFDGFLFLREITFQLNLFQRYCVS
jgi:hypothetical protein